MAGRGGWLKLTAYPLKDDVSVRETLDIEAGRMRIRNRRHLTSHSRLARLAESLKHLNEVETCHVLAWSDDLTISFEPDSAISGRLLDKAQNILESLIAAEARDRATAEPGGLAAVRSSPKVATGSERILNLVLAGGSFVMTGVGLAVPGIPFLPFLLATSYYLARSSPRLNERLRRLPFIGAILVEWEQYGRLSRLSKLKLVGLSVVVIGLSIVLIGLSPVALVVLFVISTVMIFGILHAPEIADSPGPGRAIDGSPRLALPAP